MGLKFAPAATISRRQVKTWKSVSQRKEGQRAAGCSARRRRSSSSCSPTVWGRNKSGTPPRVTVSPSFRGAEAVTASPFTAVPPLEPRS